MNMKEFLLVLFSFCQFSLLNAQTITGRIVDQGGNGFGVVQLQLYTSSRVYSTSSLPDGSFTFNNISSVTENQLPAGYSISNNFPNPFNPKTRIYITQPAAGLVSVDLYNLLGQKIGENIRRYFNAGESFIDLELNGLSSGIYLAKISFGEKYSVVKKLMLIYGSQHLFNSSINKSNIWKDKSILDLKIDSLVVTGSSFTKKVFTNLPSYTGSPLALGNLIINMPPQVPVLMGPSDGATNMMIPTTLVWNPAYLASTYTLQVSVNNSFSSFVFNQSDITSTGQQVSALNNATTYYWRVNASNNYGTTDWCPVRSFTTWGTTPPAPPALIFPANGAVNLTTSILFSWTASTGATSYTLQISTDNSFTNYIINQSGITNNSKQIDGLSYSTKYYWRVSASNGNTSSGPSSFSSFTTMASVACVGVPTITYNGKIYNTVQIGNQCWLAENLDVGTMIQGTQNPNNNGTIEKYCFNDDPNNCATYGGLYLWNEAMQYSSASGSRGICPEGWRIATRTDFQSLSASVNNDGNSLKAVGQGVGNGAGANASGFSALLAGNFFNGSFLQIMGTTSFWSSTEHGNPDYAYSLNLVAQNSTVIIIENTKNIGFSIRCIKN